MTLFWTIYIFKYVKRNYTLTSLAAIKFATLITNKKGCLPPVQATGAPAGSGHALPAGHAVQFSNLPPKEYMPAGHGTGGLLEIFKHMALAVIDRLMTL